MSELEDLLSDSVVQRAIWNVLGMSAPLPTFKSVMWYGELPNPVHWKEFDEVCVAESHADVQAFYADLIRLKIIQGMEVLTYDEMIAAAVKNMEKEKIWKRWNESNSQI